MDGASLPLCWGELHLLAHAGPSTEELLTLFYLRDVGEITAEMEILGRNKLHSLGTCCSLLTSLQPKKALKAAPHLDQRAPFPIWHGGNFLSRPHLCRLLFMAHWRGLAGEPEGEERSVTDAWEQDGSTGTGSQHRWCRDGSVHGKIVRALKGGAGVRACDGNRG